VRSDPKALEVTFAKQGAMKYISHLDVMRVFSRALRRAGLPLTITQGFTPRIKMRFERALKVGVESEHEKAVFYFNEEVPVERFTASLNSLLPKGIFISHARYL
jgi:radical SAM-linked protein